MTKDVQRAYEKLQKFEAEELGMKKGKDISKVLGMLSIGTFIVASFFGSTITGNVVNISNFSSTFSNSTIFLIAGLVFGIAWFFARR